MTFNRASNRFPTSRFSNNVTNPVSQLIAARHKQISDRATQKIQGYVDTLTGGSWLGTYEDSLYDSPTYGGLWDYRMPPNDITINFTSRGKGDSTFVAERVIKYNNTDYPETFIGSVTPDGRVVMNSMTDTDILMGTIDSRSETLSLVFFDDGNDGTSLGSRTAVGTFVFNDVSKLYKDLPLW